MRIELLAEAREDLAAGFAFYEKQAPGLGRRFLESLFADVDSLRDDAGTHRIVHGYHRCLAQRFPFAIYYKIEDESLRVWAIVDCRRDPAWIRRRLATG